MEANSFINNTIQVYSVYADLVQQLSSLEKDYSSRLEGILKKNQKKLEKLLVKRWDSCHKALEKHSVLGKSDKLSHDSVMQTWLLIKDNLVSVAAEKMHLATGLLSLNEQISNEQLEQKKEQSRNNEFMLILKAQKTEMYDKVDNLKKQFNEISAKVNKLKRKHAISANDSLKKQLHQEILEMNNTKNEYLLAIRAANAVKQKYYSFDIPQTLDDLSEFATLLNNNIQKISNELNALYKMNYQQCTTGICVTSKADCVIVLPPNLANSQPPDQVFESSGLWKEQAEIVNDEYSRDYLNNLLNDLSESIESIQQQISDKQHMLETKTSHAVKRELILLNTKKTGISAKIEAIREIVGNTECHKHSFKSSTFAIPTVCDACATNIWTINSRDGLACVDCGISCHTKCKLKVKQCKIEKSFSADSAKYFPSVKNSSELHTFLEREQSCWYEASRHSESDALSSIATEIEQDISQRLHDALFN